MPKSQAAKGRGEEEQRRWAKRVNQRALHAQGQGRGGKTPLFPFSFEKRISIIQALMTASTVLRVTRPWRRWWSPGASSRQPRRPTRWWTSPSSRSTSGRRSRRRSYRSVSRLAVPLRWEYMVGLLVKPDPACGSSLVPLQLHPRVSTLLKDFGETYAILKNPRKLDFKAQLGTVQLDLDFSGVSKFMRAWACTTPSWRGSGKAAPRRELRGVPTLSSTSLVWSYGCR